MILDKKELEDYLKIKRCRCTLKQLRTKIMNEQNAAQKRVRERMSNMMEEKSAARGK